MAKKSSLTATYESLPKIVKIIIQIFTGWAFGGVYRIIKFAEKKNIVTLIAGVVCLISGIGNLIAWIADIFTEVTKNKITFFAD